MPFTRSMILQKEEYSGEEEADESISGKDEAEMEVEAESEEGLDVYDRDAESWLQRIGLLEFARLPWSLWRDNPNAEVQFAHIKTNKGWLTDKLQVSAELFSEVFKLPHVQTPKLKKMSNSIMKSEFGGEEGTRNYYMVQNSPKDRATHFFWYLDKVCLLAKSAYMSKEAFMPL